MLKKIIFRADGYSRSVETSSILRADMDDVYDVEESGTGLYVKDMASGNIVAMTKKQYEDRYVTYEEKRKLEYPSSGDQLSEIWSILEGITDLSTSENLVKIKAVKTKHPKT